MNSTQSNNEVAEMLDYKNAYKQIKHQITTKNIDFSISHIKN